jgi:hypothetical protein
MAVPRLVGFAVQARTGGIACVAVLQKGVQRGLCRPRCRAGF